MQNLAIRQADKSLHLASGLDRTSCIGCSKLVPYRAISSNGYKYVCLYHGYGIYNPCLAGCKVGLMGKGKLNNISI